METTRWFCALGQITLIKSRVFKSKLSLIYKNLNWFTISVSECVWCVRWRYFWSNSYKKKNTLEKYQFSSESFLLWTATLVFHSSFSIFLHFYSFLCAFICLVYIFAKSVIRNRNKHLQWTTHKWIYQMAGWLCASTMASFIEFDSKNHIAS